MCSSTSNLRAGFSISAADEWPQWPQCWSPRAQCGNFQTSAGIPTPSLSCLLWHVSVGLGQARFEVWLKYQFRPRQPQIVRSKCSPNSTWEWKEMSGLKKQAVAPSLQLCVLIYWGTATFLHFWKKILPSLTEVELLCRKEQVWDSKMYSNMCELWKSRSLWKINLLGQNLSAVCLCQYSLY